MVQITEVFRGLADPTRRAVFESLAHHGEATVSQVTARFSVSQPAISQHLAALRSAGLVLARKDGRHVFYRADPAGLAPLADWIGHYERFWRGRLARLDDLLQEMDP
ncbi:MAG TPA: metalloregulator ArsR/SmtB family transcription factor [Kofleriaceae bacterium]|jgi:DNA-binding transcriptional ArsR family regulator|nr:metalloregulator ArsR/SmtB family transcription factor [Kofleriaceae bacterium]